MALAAPRPWAVPSVVPRCILVRPSGMIRLAFERLERGHRRPQLEVLLGAGGEPGLGGTTPLTPVITKKRRGRMACGLRPGPATWRPGTAGRCPRRPPRAAASVGSRSSSRTSLEEERIGLDGGQQQLPQVAPGAGEGRRQRLDGAGVERRVGSRPKAKLNQWLAMQASTSLLCTSFCASSMAPSNLPSTSVPASSPVASTGLPFSIVR